MIVVTPKKLVHGDLCCYLCNNTPSVKERIRIFGKTAHDLPQLIKSALSVDVRIYSKNDLFVCTNPCYKRLLKLEKIEKSIVDLKEELRRSFNNTEEPARVKRLRRDSDIAGPATTTTSNRSGAAKSLNFAAHTTCTSFSTTPGLIIGSKPYQLVYNAFG